MTYRFPGFSLELPDGAEDHSIIALTLSPPGDTPFSVTLIRYPLRDGITIADHVAGDVAVRETRDGYVRTWQHPHTHAGLPGFILAGNFEGMNGRVDERRLYLLSGATVLMLAALTQKMFSAAQLDVLNRLVQGLRVEKQAGPA